ncbi:MAG: alpha-ribazole phosphatase [Clostridia bacterium]|nr:alpha-ribazole phosphatase [Clostridia bacterium]
MLQLILVRHGETDSNKNRTYLGWTDVALNDDGIRQAYEAKRKLVGIKVDAIYASPLKRAYHTAEIINEAFQLEIQLEDNLKERNFGVWDNLTLDEIKAKYQQEYDLYVQDWINYCVTDGESSIQAYNRVTSFTDQLVKRNKEGTILLVTHLGCIRKIIASMLGMTIEDSWRFKLDNGSITRLEVNDEGYAYLSLLNG